MSVVYLVSCTKMKEATPKPAKRLYASELFALSRQLVEHWLKLATNRGEPGLWFILSAKHGLVDPEKILEPYNKAIYDMPRRARRQWAQEILRSLLNETRRLGWQPARTSITILANKTYWEFLTPRLESAGFIVRVPWHDQRPPNITRQFAILNWCKEWLRTRLHEIEHGDTSVCGCRR